MNKLKKNLIYEIFDFNNIKTKKKITFMSNLKLIKNKRIYKYYLSRRYDRKDLLDMRMIEMRRNLILKQFLLNS